MRADATAERIRAFLVAAGQRADADSVVFLAGGASAVLCGWRDSTRDIDIRIERGSDSLLRALSDLKNELDINVEEAGPLDFLPAPTDWQAAAVSIGRFGRLTVMHTPFALQALSKLERDIDHDRTDVQQMLALGLTTIDEIRATFDAIEPELYRSLRVNAARLRSAVERLG